MSYGTKGSTPPKAGVLKTKGKSARKQMKRISKGRKSKTSN